MSTMRDTAWAVVIFAWVSIVAWVLVGFFVRSELQTKNELDRQRMNDMQAYRQLVEAHAISSDRLIKSYEEIISKIGDDATQTRMMVQEYIVEPALAERNSWTD